MTNTAHKLLELLDRELTADDLDRISIHDRRRLAGLLDHWSKMAQASAQDDREQQQV